METKNKSNITKEKLYTKGETFTKKQRKEIYRIALDHFKKGKENDMYFCYGMCRSVSYAINTIKTKRCYRGGMNKYCLPEFYAFKPKKSTCKSNPLYWFSRINEDNGYEIRESILTAIVEGKTPEQWKKEWESSSKR